MVTPDAGPWIGLPVQMDPEHDKQYLSRDYSNAIAEAGGIPLILPIQESSDSIAAVVQRLDGIFLTGNNSDLDPELYHAPRLEQCGPVQPLRDRMDFILLETAIANKIPVLAVCYGMQSLNAFLGGTLIQDIESSVSDPVRHSSTPSDACPVHEVSIESGSILEQIAGEGKYIVNSTHHQAIDRLGRNLQVIARCPDGIIEAVFSEDDAQWILGVQWHPEKNFADDNVSRKIFELFVARCRA